MLHESSGQSYSFAEWTLAAWPLVAVLLVAGWTVILRFFPIDVASVRDADAVIEEKALRMGRPSAQERAIGLVMLGTLAAWIVGGDEFGLVAAISIVLTEVMTNSAVVALLLPVALGISQQFGIDPRAMAPAIALPAGLAFTLPVGTPGNAIAYSSGYLRLRDMLVPGSILVVIAWAAFNLVAVYYWPLIGLTLAVPPGGGAGVKRVGPPPHTGH